LWREREHLHQRRRGRRQRRLARRDGRVVRFGRILRLLGHVRFVRLLRHGEQLRFFGFVGILW
jgi:hypothetical protein